MTSTTHPKDFLLFIIALSCPCSVLAQSASEGEGKETIFELDAFTVEASSMKGYTATNSTSGTIFNTELKNVPLAIDVVTPQFIEDTGSTDVREALAYDSGVMLDNTLARSDGNNFTTGVENDDRSINNTDTDVVIRGFRAPTLKNGFFTLTRVDSVNIGRFERASGPMSLLYGIGAISGVTNIISKKPSDVNAFLAKSELSVGSKGFLRSTLDVTDTFKSDSGRSFAYRLNASYQSEDDIVPYFNEEVFFIAPVIEFSPWKSTKVLIELEYAKRSSSGNGTNDVTDGLYPRFEDDGDTADLLRDKIIGSHNVNISGPDTKTEDTYMSPRIEITQEFGKHLWILASATTTDYERDSLRTSSLQHVATGFPDAFFAAEASVQDYIDNSYIEYAWQSSSTKDEDLQSRVSILYTNDLWGEEQNLIFGRQDRGLKKTFSPDGAALIGAASLGEVNLDELPIRYYGEETLVPGTQRLDNQWYQGHYAMYTGSFFNGRIRPFLGYRWDRVQTRTRLYQRSDPDSEWIQDPNFLADRGAINGYDQKQKQETPTYGLTIGINDNLSVYAVHAEGISLANTIQRDGNGISFSPPFTESQEAGIKFTLLNGKISGRLTYFEMDKKGGVRYSFYATNPSRGNFDPSQPVIYELNDRQKNAFESWSGIDLQADYGIERQRSQDSAALKWSVPYDVLGDELKAFALYLWEEAPDFDAWRSGFNPDGPYFTSGNNPSEDRGAYHNFDEESSGYEFRLNINPVENWQTVLSYTYNEVIIARGLSNFAGGDYEYYGIHPVFYYSGGPQFFNEDFRPESYSGSLGGGVVNNDTPQHTVRIWSKYSFMEGFLEGLELGVGYRYQSERVSESPWEGARDSIQSAVGADNTRAPVPGFDLWDLMVTYGWSAWNMEWNLRLNIRNLFDLDVVTATAKNKTTLLEDGTSVPTVTRYYLEETRNIRLTLEAAF